MYQYMGGRGSPRSFGYENRIFALPKFGASMISVNDKTVFNGEMPWIMQCMQSRIDKAMQDDPFIDSFNISMGENGFASYDVINQLIGRILMQDIHVDGFKQITLS